MVFSNSKSVVRFAVPVAAAVATSIWWYLRERRRRTPVGHVSSLHIHPVKSLRAQSVDTVSFDACGLVGDRRIVVVDASTGSTVTQRQEARLALVRGTFANGENAVIPAGFLVLEAPGMPTIAVDPWQSKEERALKQQGAPGSDGAGKAMTVRIWSRDTGAFDLGNAAAGWLSRFIDREVRLAIWDPNRARPVNHSCAPRNKIVAFADEFPVLLTTEESLDDLNRRLISPVPMERFRPNIVLSLDIDTEEDGDENAESPSSSSADGAEGTVGGNKKAWMEESWKRIKIGDVVFEVVKGCARCRMTTVDPDKGERVESGEPLETLNKFRRRMKFGPVFGVNMVPHGDVGSIKVGDVVTVLEFGDPVAQEE